MKTKLIKLSDAQYIVVGENPDKMYEGWYELDNKIFHTSKYMLQNGCRVITHSTQPLEEVVWWERETRKSKLGFDKIKELSLSEVEDVINGYSIDKLNPCMGIDFRVEWENGFKAHRELVKDKLFTIEDMGLFAAELIARYKLRQIKEPDDICKIIKSWLPKTEWDVKFIDGKIKLV